MAVDRKGISNTGAYASTTMITMNKCTLIGAGPYRVPNHRAETLVVYTNKCRSAAFRGFGMSQPTFAMEVMMDIVAEKVGMEPPGVPHEEPLGERRPGGHRPGHAGRGYQGVPGESGGVERVEHGPR